ncbi:MAG: 3-oxoacyl-[acyl-carrier-protein] reductase FabG [Steroidobacteraceae bacterium]|nr:3-oxoacyl-[acyl-carrier-protein] reductase FabG [Steroidobacteraceae bacterium]
MLLADKIVVISGIGPGLGVKLAVEAARAGAAAVVIAARTAARLDDAEARVRALGSRCEVLKVPTDITDRAQCRRLAAAAAARFGRIDALVNSAFCYGPVQPLATDDLQGWREVFDTNVFGSLALTQEILPQMQRQKSGAVLFINSQAIRRPSRAAAYAASKGALRVLAAYLAREVGPQGIRVNTLLPGWMWGEPVQANVRRAAAEAGLSEEQMVEKIAASIALRRIVTDDEVARAAMLLISDLASAMTGALVDANGGEFLP